jgi:hypothetical protein
LRSKDQSSLSACPRSLRTNCFALGDNGAVIDGGKYRQGVRFYQKFLIHLLGPSFPSIDWQCRETARLLRWLQVTFFRKPIFFFFWQHWGLSTGPHSYRKVFLLLEPLCQH